MSLAVVLGWASKDEEQIGGERETKRKLPGLIEDGRRSVELLGFSLWVRGEIFGEEIGRAHV